MKTTDESVKAQTRLHDVADILKTLSEWCDLELDRVHTVDAMCNHLQKENADLKAQLKRVYADEMSSFWKNKLDEKKEEVERLLKEREDLRAELVLASTGMLYRSWIDSDEAALKSFNLEGENIKLKKENADLWAKLDLAPRKLKIEPPAQP